MDKKGRFDNMIYFTHTDLYQLNMGLSYFNEGIHEKEATFEVYFRNAEDLKGHKIFAGLEKIIDVVNNFKITEQELDYLRRTLNYPEDYLEVLKNLSFSGNIRAMKEGEVCYFSEPLLIMRAPLLEAQLLETVILNIINYQTLIASKASSISIVAKGDTLLEFGARRSYDTEAALYGARSAIIGGFHATSLVSAGMKFNLPISGTHAHSFVLALDSEYEAFKAYANSHKDVTFLIDTYNVLESGIINAMQVAREYGDRINFNAVRLDSGDLAFYSKKVREILDENGFTDVKIVASSDLDAETILHLKSQGAEIDVWGVGTKLVSPTKPSSLGCVYKLVNINGKDVIKISGNVNKVTMPGIKNVYRLIDKVTGKAKGDIITLKSETLEGEYTNIYNQFNQKYKRRLTTVMLKPLLIDIFVDGVLKHNPSTSDVINYAKESKSEFWDEHLRFMNPETYYISFSEKANNLKKKLLKEHNADRDN